MIYGPFQYYKDELNSWKRIIAFHKEELREAVSQLGVLPDPQIISLTSGKMSDIFTDQLIVQEQQFDYITNLITSQYQRLDRALSHSQSIVEDALSNHQDLLRAKMKSLEQNFLRTKYSCSVFLSTFLSKSAVAITQA